jgi:hypothetical protein
LKYKSMTLMVVMVSWVYNYPQIHQVITFDSYKFLQFNHISMKLF